MHDTKSLSAVVPFIVPLINALTNSNIKEIETEDERVIVNYMTFCIVWQIIKLRKPLCHTQRPISSQHRVVVLFHHNTQWWLYFIIRIVVQLNFITETPDLHAFQVSQA